MTPPRKSVAHDLWIGAFEKLARENPGTAVEQCSTFAAEVLKRCGMTEELAQFIDERSLVAMEAEHGN